MQPNNFQYSQNGCNITKQFESCRLTAYYDLKGKLTIGWGHTGQEVVPGLVWTQAQADEALLHDIQNAVNVVNGLVKSPLTQQEFDALVDFVFNVGSGNFRTSTMLELLNEGYHQRAAAQFDLWDYAGGKVVAGLLRRREAETQEFNETAS